MMTMNDTPAPSDAQRRAADWFARLNDAAAEADAWQEFTVWLEADPAHRVAYDQVEALWVALDAAEPVTAAAQAEVVAFTPRRRSIGPWAIGGLAAAAAVAALIVGPQLMTAPVQTFEAPA